MREVSPPVDVRLMNATASMVYVAVFLLVCASAVSWLLRNPAFAITQIVVYGDPHYISALNLRAKVLPQLHGNLFTLDLVQARKAFEEEPWVRHAEIRRVFPNTIDVMLQEQQPVALWGDADASTMLNNYGEVFEANRGEVEHQNLPHLAGPTDQSMQVLAMFRFLKRELQTSRMQPVALYLTPRGNWQMFLNNGAQIELGSGQELQVGVRLDEFFKSLPEVLQPLGVNSQQLEYADLRYHNGYAIRLRGVLTEPGKDKPRIG